MLFTAIARRKVYKDPFTCWICLDEETDQTNQKKLWYKHSCHCNLQIHKKCYLTLIYKSIQDITSSLQGDVYGTPISQKYLKGSLSSFIYHNGYHPLDTLWWAFKRFMPSLIINAIKNTLLSYVYDEKILAEWRTPFITWKSVTTLDRITEDTLPEIFKTNLDHLPKCPQCKKAILSSHDMNFIHQPIWYWAYDKLLEYVDYFFFIGVSVSLLANPLAILLEIGLWQLRCIFPESQLRYILNLETSRTLDVYFKSLKGIASISGINKVIVGGFPLYLFGTTCGITKQFPIIILTSLFWSTSFTQRLGSYKKIGVDIPLLRKVSSRSITICSVYYIMARSILYFGLTPTYIIQANISQRKDERKGKFQIDKYFAKLKESNMVLFAQSIIWPFLGKLTGKCLYFAYVTMKRYYNLNDTDIVPDFYASSDEYQMIFNLMGMGIVGLSSSIFSRLAWINRYKRKLETEALVEGVINEAEH
ncbi:hypothetical protein MOUN0_O11518 [Monosporozyma unispora]|nr:hypothetical protein C6P44_000013 [Kazachstania unispora]